MYDEQIVKNIDISRLAEQAKRGDRESLVSLCSAIARGVLFRTMYFIRNRMDAEDAAQEVLIRVCEKIHGLNDPKAFSGWLNSIVENETKRYLTKNAKHSSVINMDDYLDADIEEDDEVFLPDEYTIKEDDSKAVMEIIDKLPEQQRKVIFLHYYEGMKVTETAQAMDISQSTASHYLKLAQEKIRSEIQIQSKKTGTMYGIAFLPIGSILTNTFHQEAAQIPQISNLWIEKAVSESIGQTINTATAQTAGTSLGLTTTVISVAASVLVVAGLWLGGVFSNPQDIPVEQGMALEAEGEVVFIGGESYRSYENPKQAVARAHNERGEIIALDWWIAVSGNEAVLYSGEGGIVDETLMSMYERGEDGEYTLNFNMKDAAGVTYTLTRQFIIRADNG